MQDRHRRTLLFNRCPILHPVLFYDDAEGTFHYVAAGDGADYITEYSNEQAVIGNKSLKLSTRLTDAAIADQVSAAKSIWLSPHKVLNLTACFCRGNDVTSTLDFLLTWDDGAQIHAAGIRFDRTLYRASYISSGGTWSPLADGLFNADSTPVWNKVRLSIDLSIDQYISAVVNHQILDLTGTAFAVSTPAVLQKLELTFVVTTAQAQVATWYIDEILLRGDNP